jgi:hypothetical protein
MERGVKNAFGLLRGINHHVANGRGKSQDQHELQDHQDIRGDWTSWEVPRLVGEFYQVSFLLEHIYITRAKQITLYIVTLKTGRLWSSYVTNLANTLKRQKNYSKSLSTTFGSWWFLGMGQTSHHKKSFH